MILMPNPMIRTMDDIRHVQEDFLSVETVANVLHINPDRLRGYIRSGEFDVTVRKSGNRLMISRESLLSWYEGKETKPDETEMDRQLRRIADALEMILQMIPFMTESGGRFAQAITKLEKMKEAAV